MSFFHRPPSVALWYPICGLLNDRYVSESFRFDLVAN